MDNDLIKIQTAIMHLKRASTLVTPFNNDLGLCILEIADAICKDYMVQQKDIDEIENIEKEISGGN